MRRLRIPVVAALLGLLGSLAATLLLYRAAAGALGRVQEERLRGAGQTASQLLGEGAPSPALLRAIMVANGLDGAYVLSPSLEVVADATGPSGGRADLLRTDAARVHAALGGQVTVGRTYEVGSLTVQTAYFPLRGRASGPAAVLALEAGKTFAAAQAGLQRALSLGIALAFVGGVALFLVAARWSGAEARAVEAASRAARGEATARMASAVAHEIRNPLGIIRGAVELIRERTGPQLGARDRERLQDVLGEVERLRVLTDDFLDLSADRPLERAPVDLSELVAEAAHGNRALYPDLNVSIDISAPPVEADAGRLRQVFANLLANAAQAGARRVEIRGGSRGDHVGVIVADDGPGVPAPMQERLFEPFVSGRPGGTGLGLAISQRIAERHGGSLELLEEGPGAVFELRLPHAG
jgi:signal transduction histidine kinase